MTENNFRSGFVALIGRPNVGKSTLLNYVVGQKVAIMSDVAQPGTRFKESILPKMRKSSLLIPLVFINQ